MQQAKVVSPSQAAASAPGFTSSYQSRAAALLLECLTHCREMQPPPSTMWPLAQQWANEIGGWTRLLQLVWEAATPIISSSAVNNELHDSQPHCHISPVHQMLHPPTPPHVPNPETIHLSTTQQLHAHPIYPNHVASAPGLRP